MKTILNETKDQLDRTHNEIEKRLIQATQEITDSKIQITTIRDEIRVLEGGIGNAPDIVRQMSGITQLQQNLHARAESMSRLIEEIQGNLHQVVEGCADSEMKI